MGPLPALRMIWPGNVGKVEVDDDILAVADELGDGADGLLQNIIRNAECVGEGDLLVGDEFQAVVRDNDHGIDLIGEVGNAGLSLLHAVRALQRKGFVTTATVRMPASCATCAMWVQRGAGAAAIPAVMQTMSVPSST